MQHKNTPVRADAEFVHVVMKKVLQAQRFVLGVQAEESDQVRAAVISISIL
jgi:hypothetical protein